MKKKLKWCARCRKKKSGNSFYSNKSSSSGLSYYCKVCHNATLNPNAESHMFATLKYTYGLTKEEYQKLETNQKGRCAICDRKPDRRLDVDHDHKTTKVRGLLCNSCNMGIGLLRENPRLIQRALAYLEGRMSKFKVLIVVNEEREYVVEASSAGAAETLVEAELDSIPFKVTERDLSYTSAYQIKPENED